MEVKSYFRNQRMMKLMECWNIIIHFALILDQMELGFRYRSSCCLSSQCFLIVLMGWGLSHQIFGRLRFLFLLSSYHWSSRLIIFGLLRQQMDRLIFIHLLLLKDNFNILWCHSNNYHWYHRSSRILILLVVRGSMLLAFLGLP